MVADICSVLLFKRFLLVSLSLGSVKRLLRVLDINCVSYLLNFLFVNMYFLFILIVHTGRLSAHSVDSVSNGVSYGISHNCYCFLLRISQCTTNMVWMLVDFGSTTVACARRLVDLFSAAAAVIVDDYYGCYFRFLILHQFLALTHSLSLSLSQRLMTLCSLFCLFSCSLFCTGVRWCGVYMLSNTLILNNGRTYNTIKCSYVVCYEIKTLYIVLVLVCFTCYWRFFHSLFYYVSKCFVWSVCMDVW